jgi:DNA-binding winged helix-turn-helix (wHTH) protein
MVSHGGNGQRTVPCRLCFDRFEVVPASRSVLRDGKPVELGGRAFDLLMVLLRSRGEVVSKDEIVQHVWPRTIVGEDNLRVHVSLLRRSLGTARDLFKTVSGRGYLFAAEIEDRSVRKASLTAIGMPMTHWGSGFSYAR